MNEWEPLAACKAGKQQKSEIKESNPTLKMASTNVCFVVNGKNMQNLHNP